MNEENQISTNSGQKTIVSNPSQPKPAVNPNQPKPAVNQTQQRPAQPVQPRPVNQANSGGNGTVPPTNVNKPKPEPDYDEVEVYIPKKVVRKDSYYDGKVIPYWAYNGLSATLTATGAGGAWGTTIKTAYKYNHTSYNGKRIKFEGKGIDLYPEMFKWVLFSILTLGIYILWIPIKKQKWIVSKLHFEDEEYVEGYSYFDGKLLGLIGVNIFTYFLTAISFGLLLPYAHCYKQRWYAKHTVISRKRIIFEGKALGLFGNYIKWWFFTIITFGIYGLWLPLKIYSWEVDHTRIKLKSDPDYETSKAPMIIGGIILVVFLLAIIVGTIGNISHGSFNLNRLNPLFWSGKIVRNAENSIQEREQDMILEAVRTWQNNNGIQDYYKTVSVRTLIDEGYLAKSIYFEDGCVEITRIASNGEYDYDVRPYCN